MRSSPPAALRGRREVLAQLREPRRDLLLVHRLQEAIERGLREQQAQEQPEQPIEPRRPDLLGAAVLIAGGAADAGGDAAHLEAARVQPLEARARVGRQAAEHRDERDRRRRRPPRRAAGLAGGVDLRVDRRAEPRHRHQAGQVGELAGGDQRQQHRRERRQRRGGGAAEEEQQVPPEEKRFLQVVGHPGALRRCDGWRRRCAACIERRGHGACHRSVARPRRRRQAVHDVADLAHALDERRLAQHLLRRHASAAAPSISRMIVPGADEKT